LLVQTLLNHRANACSCCVSNSFQMDSWMVKYLRRRWNLAAEIWFSIPHRFWPDDLGHFGTALKEGNPTTGKTTDRNQCDLGPMFWFLKIFLPKNSAKKWRFWLKTMLSYAKFWS
jgi:hypothetical protein